MKLVSCHCRQCKYCRRSKSMRFLMKKLYRRKARRIEKRCIKKGDDPPTKMDTGYWA